MNLGDPRLGGCTGEDDILMILMILMMSIKMGVGGTCTVENLLKIPSGIYRRSHRTSIEHRSNIYMASRFYSSVRRGVGEPLLTVPLLSGKVPVSRA